MEQNTFEYEMNHLFNFNIDDMKKILLHRYNKDNYNKSFKHDLEYNIPEVISSIVDIESIILTKKN